MSASTKTCGGCGHANSGDAMFCSKCGARLPDQRDAPREPAPPIAEAAPRPLSEPPASKPAAAKPAAKAAASEPPKKPARRVAGAAKTMLGMPMDAPAASVEPEPPEEQEEEDGKPAPHRRVGASARTMLGMPAPDRAAIAQAVEDAKAKKAAQHAAEEPSTARGLGPAAQEAFEAAATIDEASAATEAHKRAVLAQTNRTMLGQPAPKVPVPEEPAESEPARRSSYPPGPRGRAPVVYPTDTGEQEALTLPKKRSALPAIALLSIGVIVLLVGGGLLAYSLLTSGSDVRASVVQGAEGEMLQIEVPGAAAGTRVRFHGGEETLEAGRARFPLSADDLSIGDNELALDVIAPDGSVDTETIALHLEMRVRADLGPLASAPAAIDVVVEAAPGSEVTLDGQALELDSAGRGTRRYEIDAAEANAEGVVEHVVRYRVVPPAGDAAQGDLRTRIPITTLQIDRPGEQLVTDRTSVEIAGAVAPGSTVTVAGEEVEVRLGRFLTTRQLPAPGEHTIEVVARAPGKAARVARIRIRRVEDLEAEAARFEVDRDLTYARIAQNPTTYRGRNVAFEGVVFNVDVRNGRSVLQILVSECPAGTQCPLWVTYPAATDAENRSRVRVLGTVQGVQQYRSQSGEIRTVPRVDATFVLPAPAPGERGR